MTPATWTTSKSSPSKSMLTTGTGSAGPIRFPRTIGPSGKSLTRAAVLRSLTHVRAQHADAGSAKATNHVALDPSWKRENLRFVVFLQEPKTLHIFGAAAG